MYTVNLKAVVVGILFYSKNIKALKKLWLTGLVWKHKRRKKKITRPSDLCSVQSKFQLVGLGSRQSTVG